MHKLEFCKICLIPNTRPNIFFNKKDICNVCSTKNSINWTKRKKEFLQIVKSAKKMKQSYDCLIPVSGGKDSTWQVMLALKYKLKPLCITWRSPARNKIGEDNLKNLISLGVDHIDFTINPIKERYFILESFKKFGSTLIPMHMAMHGIVVKTAIEKKIPLIIWGENSAEEYGGEEKLKGKFLTNKWRKVYGNTNNTSAFDWIDKKLSKKDMIPYTLPKQEKINKKKIKEIFLSYFFKWDPKKTYLFSKKYGFKPALKPKTGFYKYADIDDEFLVTIHHWLKWHKFGFSRMWDNLAIEIRNKRINKSKAIKKIIEIEKKIPKKEISKFCNYVKIKEKTFYKICEKFRNKDIWYKKKKNWFIKNSIISNWHWVK